MVTFNMFYVNNNVNNKKVTVVNNKAGPELTSFWCLSSSFILISLASALAARFAASLASA